MLPDRSGRSIVLHQHRKPEAIPEPFGDRIILPGGHRGRPERDGTLVSEACDRVERQRHRHAGWSACSSISRGLDVNLGASGGPSVGLERALNSRVSVGVKAGASAAQTGVGVDIRVSDKVKVQGEVGANGAASVGVGVEHEW